MKPELTIENVKLLAGAVFTVLGAVVVAIGFLIRVSYKLGQNATTIAKALESLTEIKLSVAKIPVLETRLGNAEEAWRSTRSDIKHLLRRPSNHDFNGSGSEE